jgi:hypothetical protein
MMFVQSISTGFDQDIGLTGQSAGRQSRPLLCHSLDRGAQQMGIV